MAYHRIGRPEEALVIEREIYAKTRDMNTAINLSSSLMHLGKHSEARSFSAQRIKESKRKFGPDHNTTLMLQQIFAQAIYHDRDASLDDVTRAVDILESLLQKRRQVLGSAHRITADSQKDLDRARLVLAAHQHK